MHVSSKIQSEKACQNGCIQNLLSPVCKLLQFGYSQNLCEWSEECSLHCCVKRVLCPLPNVDKYQHQHLEIDQIWKKKPGGLRETSWQRTRFHFHLMPFKQKQWSQSLPRGGVRAVAHQHSKGAFTLQGGDISQGKKVGLSACTSQQGCGRAAGHARQPIQLALSSLWLYLLLCSHHIPAVWLAKVHQYIGWFPPLPWLNS